MAHVINLERKYRNQRVDQSQLSLLFPFIKTVTDWGQSGRDLTTILRLPFDSPPQMLFIFVAIFLVAFIIASVIPRRSNKKRSSYSQLIQKQKQNSGVGLSSESRSSIASSESIPNAIIEMPAKVLTNVKIFYSCAKDQAGVCKTISMRAHEFLVSYNLVERNVTPKSLNAEIPPELFLSGSICIFFIAPSTIGGDSVNNLETWLKRILLDQGAGQRIRLDGLRYAIFSIDTDASELNRCLKQLGARNIIHMGEGKSEPNDLLDISFREWMMDLVILLRSYTFILNHPPPVVAQKIVSAPNPKAAVVDLESEEDKENTRLLNS